jgi:DNA repair exonuclease SbcCD nuclease subunit
VPWSEDTTVPEPSSTSNFRWEWQVLKKSKKKEMKILFIGDPHFKTTNLDIAQLLIDQCLELISNHRPDFTIIAGDVLHTHERLHTSALNKALEFIDSIQKKCPVYVLVGNHDFINNQQFLTQNHWMNALKKWENVVIVDTVVKRRVVDHGRVFQFFMVPYVPVGRFVEALNANGDDSWKESDCVFAHQEFFGCKMGHIISTEGDKWELGWPFVVSGHIHSRQMPQINILYPGSSIQHAFGESESNGVALLDWDNGSKYPTTTDLVISIPRMKTLSVDVRGFEDLKYDLKINERLKIICHGSQESFKVLKKTKKFKEFESNGVHLVFKHYQIPRSDFIASKNKNFFEILDELVINSKNEILNSIYREIKME